MKYVLGLDLGTNSIGWSCIDENNCQILGADSRIFPEGVDRDTKGKEVSKNTKRREARQLRRRLQRSSQRKGSLRGILTSIEMFPRKEDMKSFFEFPKGTGNGSPNLQDVYYLRKKGLYEQLTPLEYGRALYHLNQRRGFKSTRKAEKAKEDGTVHEATTQLLKEIKDNDCKTLGEYLATLNPMERRIRNRYTLRQMYEDEFDALWQAQKQFHPQLTEDLIKKIRNEIIFYQRPLKSQAKLIGFCSLEPKKRRCAKEKLTAQRYRILETVNRLTLVDENGECHDFFQTPDMEIPPQVAGWRETLIQELWKKSELKFVDIKKLLGVPESWLFNLEKKGESKLKGNTTGHAFSKIFGKTWHSMPLEEQEKIHQVVRGADDPEWLERYACEKWTLPEDKAKKLAHKTGFQSGYLHYSTKAINRLLPHLEEGLRLSDAKEAAGYTRNAEESAEPETLIKNLRNPIVQQTLYELRHLLEALRKEFGEPDMIRVELARELKASAKKRNELHFENQERRNQHDEIRQRLIEENIKPTRDSIIQYKLWNECGRVCPYTGRSISKGALFGPAPEFQIEHILPYSRSLDDSFKNMTLCHVDENKRKGNKTPHEFYQETEQYDEILRRLKRNIHEHGMPYNKLRKFTQKEIGDDFIARQLNDTAYISRQSKKLMEAMGFKVQITKGQATAELRHLWGLNTLISTNPSKNRGDHRHHAIDATVVAMTNVATLKKLSSYNKYERAATEHGFPAPWVHFREDLKPHIQKMLISYKVNKRARGALHKEMRFGVTKRTSEDGSPLYVIRKKLEDLSSSSVKMIVDPTVREIVYERLRQQGIDPEQKNFNIPAQTFKEPLYMKSTKGKKIPIKKVRIEEVKNNAIILPNGVTAVEPGGNHHIVLYRYKDKKGNLKQGGEVCTVFEANRRRKDGEPIIRRDPGPGKDFLMSLAINEMVLLDKEEQDVDWNNPDLTVLSENLYRVQKISNQITFRHHLLAILKDEEGKELGVQRPTHSSFKGIKVRVDRIGRIFKAHD